MYSLCLSLSLYLSPSIPSCNHLVMPAVKPIFNAGRLLQDDDCDIQDECSTVEDGVLDIRRKFALVVSEGRQLQRAVLAQQAEIEDLQTRLSGHEHSAVTRNQLLAQGRRLQEHRNSEKMLRLRVRKLTRDLEVERASLKRVSYLKCDICMASIKDVVAPCGHGFCKQCLIIWLRQPKEVDTGEESENCCPHCRRPLQERDLLNVFLESGRETSPVAEEDGATEILDSDGD